MACVSGSNIVNDGLVFHFDMENGVKSWKGKPTTNFFTNGHFANGQGIPQEGGSNPTNTIILFPNNPGDSDYVLEQSMGIAQTEYQINLTTELLSSTTYVMSGWYGESLDYSSADGSRMFHSRAFSSSGANIALGTGIGTVVETKVINGITWRYCFATITTPADYSNNFNWYVGYGGSSYTGIRYYTNIQMEQGTFPTRFVNGTRSNTEAILDWTGNNTITANSLTYNADGTFEFNGTTDFLDTNQTFKFDQTGQFSVDFWINFISHSDRATAAAGIVGKGHYYNNGWDIWLRNNHQIAFETSGDPTRQGLNYLNTASLALNTWHYYSATYNNGLKSNYVNGNLIGTQTYSGPGNFTNNNNVLIGRRFGDSSRSLRGSLSAVKIYNRALTAAEVAQNFAALRRRYGI